VSLIIDLMPFNEQASLAMSIAAGHRFVRSVTAFRGMEIVINCEVLNTEVNIFGLCFSYAFEEDFERIPSQLFLN